MVIHMIERNEKPPNKVTEKLVDKTSNAIIGPDKHMNETCPEDAAEVILFIMIVSNSKSKKKL